MMHQQCGNRGSRRAGQLTRRGNILVLSAVLMVVLLGMVAFAVDVGYIHNTNAELKRTADAAALAGVSVLVDGTEAAYGTVTEYVAANPVNGVNVSQSETEIETGMWDDEARTFTPADETPTAIRVRVRRDDQGLFFARVLGRDNFDAAAESIATFRPRDIMLVLDYSASMNDDSEFKSFSLLGQAAVEANLQEIYGELGSPAWGNMAFAPAHFRQTGRTPQNVNEAQIYVTFKPTEIYVTSSKNLENVVLQFSDNAKQTFSGLSGTAGTFKGTGGNNNKWITRAWVKSGTYLSGEGTNYGERFEDTVSRIKTYFNVNSTAFPSSGTSWDTWINYVKNDSTNKSAGYQRMYGKLNVTNYLLEERPRYNQTPTLWQTSEQPITALKNSVTVFLSYLQEVDTDDRLGLSVYNSAAQTAVLESGLTDNFQLVEDISRQRQAGHYDEYTNIGAGMQKARLELQNNARVGAQKIMILMTDGIANKPTNTTTAKAFVRQEAALAAAAKIPIVTISLGLLADTALMDEVAATTGGVHFNVEGGRPIEEVEEELKETFGQVADDRPLKLVQ
ncbi:MAG: VWA domain-containing protein [Planctomycetia bacterium]|nr:VWA domain-containing protein [Planctomycetia bacterium]